MANSERLYAAYKAKDTRFDGRFFVGISSTGIYCRPICRTKLAKVENCTFYTTAAEAEQAGYRPCLLCRPELAPGTSEVELTLASRAARLLEDSCGSGSSMTEISTRLGCSDRHLRRVFGIEYRVTPIEYLQTCRLLLAKQLLTDTNLSILDIAMASGFGSLRRFNDLFKKRYHLSPTALRKNSGGENKKGGIITLGLGYRPPYPFEEVLHFLKGRAIPGIELVKEHEYYRTVHLQDADGNDIYGWLKVSQQKDKHILNVTLSETLLPVLPQVFSRIRHLFDLDCNPEIIQETLSSMNDLQPGLSVLGRRLPGCFNAFEMSVRAVLGQQITVKAASTLATRFVNTYGLQIETDIEGLDIVFPTPEKILSLGGLISDHLGPLGIIATRAKTILELAQTFHSGSIDFSVSANPELEIRKLLAISGIGNWTAQYIAMRTMGWTDAFLETDVGVKKALHPRSPKEMLLLSEAWRPWRSYAVINLWYSE